MLFFGKTPPPKKKKKKKKKRIKDAPAYGHENQNSGVRNPDWMSGREMHPGSRKLEWKARKPKQEGMDT